MKKYTILVCFVCSLALFKVSKAETMTAGPFLITNSSVAYYPQFPASTGYLHSVTFEISDFTINYDIIVDNDETNALPFDFNDLTAFNLVAWYPVISGYGIAFSTSNNLTGIISGADDGDGDGSYDGGSDEMRFEICHSNLTGQISISSSAHLANHTGSSQNNLSISSARALGPFSIGTLVEVYVTNTTYNGSLYVHYIYDDQCLVPEFKTISCVSNATIRLDIENLSVGSSNTIQRCLDLKLGDWVDARTFTSSSWTTNWSEQISNDWTSAFYRILSK